MKKPRAHVHWLSRRMTEATETQRWAEEETNETWSRELDAY